MRQGASRPPPAGARCLPTGAAWAEASDQGHPPGRHLGPHDRVAMGSGAPISDRATLTRSRRGCRLASPPSLPACGVRKRAGAGERDVSSRCPRASRQSPPRTSLASAAGVHERQHRPDEGALGGIACGYPWPDGCGARPTKSQSKCCGPRPSSCASAHPLERIVPPLPFVRAFSQFCRCSPDHGGSASGREARRSVARRAALANACRSAVSSLRTMTAQG